MTEVPIVTGERPDGFWDRVRRALHDLAPAGNARASGGVEPAIVPAPVPVGRAAAEATPMRLQAALRQAWDYCEQRRLTLSLLIVEIDAFRQFRADYGPLRAETYRAGVEIDVRALLPRTASFLGRHGVGRFVIVAPDCPILLARAAANRMGADVLAASAVLTGSAEGIATVSVGVAAINPRGGRPALLLDAAEKALAAARDRGNGRIESIDMRRAASVESERQRAAHE